MKLRFSFLFSPLSSLANRLRRARSGSVLIIVIVLLLLLAILGAAYLSTTRSDRVASAQNVLNADVDTMLNGVAKICDGVIVDDLNDTFSNLQGNTAYLAPASPIINRSYYQGQAGTTPPILSNVPTTSSYSPGDIVNDAINSFIFYSVPQGNSTSLPPGTGVTPSATATTGWQVMNGHLPFTAVGSDPWLADRIPDAAGAAGAPQWQNLTQSIQVTSTGTPPIATLAPASILGTPFEDPDYARTAGATSSVITAALSTPLVGGSPTAPTPLIPTSVQLSNGYNVPALSYSGGATFAAADADGDGIADSLFTRIPGMSVDGLTWFVGVRIIDNNSAINANTAWSRDYDYLYSAGVPATPAGPNNYWGLFPTSVGLQELINVADTANTPASPANLNLNKYRFNDSSTVAPHPFANQTPYDESAIYGSIPPAAFSRNTGGGSGDYSFLSEGEAFYQQFIRRIANPGYNTYVGGNPPTGSRYQPFPLSDEAALASHFCLRSPNTSTPQTILESLLPTSLWNTAPSAPYDPSQTNTAATGWFATNFAYPAPSATDNLTLPMRSLLVTRNPVSNYIQQIYNNNTNNPGGAVSSSDPLLPNYMLPYGSNTGGAASHFRGEWSNNASYNVNDIVVFPGPTPPTSFSPTGLWTGPSYTFIAVAANAPGSPPPAGFSSNQVLTSVATATWQLQPWSANPVKANVNTATFRELFRAFWSVMAGNPSYSTPFGQTGVDNYLIYDGAATNPQCEFRSPLRDPIGSGTANVSLLDVPGAPVGTPPVATVTNTNVMLLRAALAAVNAMGLRDNSQNVISRTIILQNNSQIDNGGGSSTPAPVEVQVYSNAPQPVISEVYANTYTGSDSGNGTPNLQGYVAVELYNPYSVTLTLTNWQLGLINRGAGSAYPNLSFVTTGVAPNQVSAIGPMQALNDPTKPGLVVPPAGVIIIPAHGYALLENYNGSGAAPQAGDATCRPVSAVSQPVVAAPPTPAIPGSFWQTTAGTPAQTGIWYGPTGQGAGTVLPNTCDVYVPNLQVVISGTTFGAGASLGGELVLLRPRQANGTLTSSTDPQNTFNEISSPAVAPALPVPNLVDLVPVDSFDFSGLTLGTTASGSAWSYVRMKGSNPVTWFKQIFPGFYDATQTPRDAYSAALGGTATVLITTPIQNPGWPYSVNPAGGAEVTSALPSFGFDANVASYPNNFPPVQVYNLGVVTDGSSAHFPNPTVTPLNPSGVPPTPALPTNMHPLGGFARNGDMLDIPFIGAYRIRQVSTIVSSPQSFLELNSLPMDCSLAAVNSTVATQTTAQNIGRFVPMAASAVYVAQLQNGFANLPDYYAWTRNIFNYLTTQLSTNTFLPNFDPNYSASNTTAPTFAYPPQNSTTPPPVPPTPVLTANGAATDQTTQDNVGVDGLININTASWKVLSMLPMVTPANEIQSNSTLTPAAAIAQAISDNQNLAQAIVAWRETHQPFTSIFDLNQVTRSGSNKGFQNAWGTYAPIYTPTVSGGIPTTTQGPTSGTGILSPPDSAFPQLTASAGTNPPGSSSGIGEDYQGDCLTLTRISNLITTRSDTFTVYIVVQGWGNVGTVNAQPMITRRYSFIADRSAINADPSSRFLKTLTVPND